MNDCVLHLNVVGPEGAADCQTSPMEESRDSSLLEKKEWSSVSGERGIMG